MSLLLRTWAIFVIAAKRLLSQRGLALATTVGLVMAVALTLSVPLYADAVYYRILIEELTAAAPGDRVDSTELPILFTFRYLGVTASATPQEWEEVQPVDAYLSGPARAALGLPENFMVRHFKTDTFKFFPEEDIAYADTKDPLTWVSFAYLSDIENQIKITEGRFPAVTPGQPDSTVEVLISSSMADELGLQVGETYITFASRRSEEGTRTIQIPIRISGFWQPLDPEASFWFIQPRALEDELIIPEATYLGRISPYLEDEVYVAVWHMVMDGSNIHTGNAASLLTRINIVRQQTASLLPETRLVESPAAALQEYQQAARLLTILLFAFSVPIIGLTLTFIGLVVGLAVGRQRNEIAVLRSRGATAVQVVGIAILESLLLGALALAVGLPVSEGVVRLIGQTRSFLDFTAQSNLRVAVTTIPLPLSLGVVGLVLAAQVLPTISAARHTVVTYKQEQARSLRRPWWQRAWLDVLLLIPAGYGAYLLQQQGTIALPLAAEGLTDDPFQNPLLFLVPALAIFALTLFILRLLPPVMAGLGWLVAHTGSVSLLMAVRYLARTPGFYAAPLVLLILTLSLSIFTASLAQTLDNQLFDQTHYRIGADMSAPAFGELTGVTGGIGPAANSGNLAGSTGEDTGPIWLFLPISEYLKLPGVEAATRIAHYEATAQVSGQSQEGRYIGLDRIDFPGVAFWRRDFAPDSLGTLMNTLAVTPNGLLAPRGFLRQHTLRVGDTIPVRLTLFGQRRELQMEIVGGFDLFPTWYPPEGPLFVGNLDYLFQEAGGQFPYDVWMKTGSNVDYNQLAEEALDLDIFVRNWKAPLLDIFAEQRRPERQGLFGVLSVGFMAAALLTVLGFLLYSLFSFRRRFIELGTLRAIGLSSGQMTGFLIWELAFLILTGLAAGTGLGLWVSRFFIPYLQIGSDPSARIPPFQVEIAWPAIYRIYALFGLLFIVALVILAVLLRRMKIFQALKLGETV